MTENVYTENFSNDNSKFVFEVRNYKYFDDIRKNIILKYPDYPDSEINKIIAIYLTSSLENGEFLKDPTHIHDVIVKYFVLLNRRSSGSSPNQIHYRAENQDTFRIMLLHLKNRDFDSFQKLLHSSLCLNFQNIQLLMKIKSAVENRNYNLFSKLSKDPLFKNYSSEIILIQTDIYYDELP